jgi:hypothetical protein
LMVSRELYAPTEAPVREVPFFLLPYAPECLEG